jgi:ribosomal protein S18 acetylase RimI-like enzyme
LNAICNHVVNDCLKKGLYYLIKSLPESRKGDEILEYLNKYKICKANSEEWARYHAIYRLANFNEWMSLSFQNDIERYEKTDFCYWVIVANKRIGGAFIKPNMLKSIFTIPPFHNNKELIEVLTLHVTAISDKGYPIVVPDADVNQVDCYKNVGFNLERIEKLMVCPTNEFEISLEERYKFVTPKLEHSEAMANLYFQAYSNNKFDYIASQSYEFQATSVQIFFDHIKSTNVTNEWSTLVYDTVKDKFIGACTVGFVNGLPYILDFVVHPEYQGKGLASKMIQRTLSLQHRNYPAIRLNVSEGNDAEEFYYKLGFISLARKGYMNKII